MDICVISMSWLLWLMLQWTQGCRYIFKIQISFTLDVHPEVELLDNMLVLFLTFRGTSILFSIVAAPLFNFPPTIYRLNTREVQVKTTEKPFWAFQTQQMPHGKQKNEAAARTDLPGPPRTSVRGSWNSTLVSRLRSWPTGLGLE